MGKPKTLKELQQHSPGKFGGMSRCEYKCSREIRKEAIKWVNHYTHLEYIEEENGVDCTREIQWIMNFFNIKEEELK